jgi:hypothetical protein
MLWFVSCSNSPRAAPVRARNHCLGLSGCDTFQHSFPLQDTYDVRAAGLELPRSEAQQMAYCLRKMGVIHGTGKQGNALLYSRQVDAAGIGAKGK